MSVNAIHVYIITSGGCWVLLQVLCVASIPQFDDGLVGFCLMAFEVAQGFVGGGRSQFASSAILSVRGSSLTCKAIQEAGWKLLDSTWQSQALGEPMQFTSVLRSLDHLARKESPDSNDASTGPARKWGSDHQPQPCSPPSFVLFSPKPIQWGLRCCGQVSE